MAKAHRRCETLKTSGKAAGDHRLVSPCFCDAEGSERGMSFQLGPCGNAAHQSSWLTGLRCQSDCLLLQEFIRDKEQLPPPESTRVSTWGQHTPNEEVKKRMTAKNEERPR